MRSIRKDIPKHFDEVAITIIITKKDDNNMTIAGEGEQGG